VKKIEQPKPRTEEEDDGDVVVRLTDDARKYLQPRSREELGYTSSRRRISAEGNARVAASLEEEFVSLIKSGGLTGFTGSEFADTMLLVNEEERARYRALGEKLWKESASEKERIQLLRCFPDRADWAKAIADERTANKHGMGDIRDLMLSTLTDRAHLIQVVKHNGVAACVVNIVPRMREEAVPVLEAMFEHIRFPNEEKAICRALSCIGTLEAATLFSKNLRKQNVRPFATEFYARYPALARQALAELAKKKTQVAEIARTILAGLDRAEETSAAAAAVASDDSSKDAEMIASIDELPAILREAPWSSVKPESSPRKRKKKSAATAVAAAPAAGEPAQTGIEVPLEPLRFHWSDHARRRFVASRFSDIGLVRDDEAVAAFKTQLANAERVYLYGNYPLDVAFPLLERPQANVHIFSDTVPWLLAAHGQKVLRPIVEHHVEKLPAAMCLFIESPRIAEAFARRHLHFYANADRSAAVAWLERFPEPAALGLLTTLLIANDRGRVGAEIGLRHLLRTGHESVVRKVAEQVAREQTPAGERALRALENLPKTAEAAAKAPKMPAFWRVNELRAPRLKNGKALPREAVELLDQLLATSASIDLPSVDFTEIREACEPRSLAEHAWDLARAWDINGAKERDRWMLHAIGHIGDDEVVRRLTPALKGEGIAPMLGVIGTDAALMELVTILVRVSRSGTARNRPKYSWGAEDALALIAARRGLDRYDLEDYFVPTCNVGADGRIVLDLGGRKVTVTFDAQLHCLLHDEEGARQKQLPRTGKDIDSEKAALAATLFTDLQEDVAAIAELRAMSLERAMIDGRTWSMTPALSLRASAIVAAAAAAAASAAASAAAASSSRPSSTSDFAAVWVDHPLMKHMGRGVVWEARARDGRRLAFFRIAEDGSFADENDDHIVELPVETTQIGVAHPARMTAEQRNKLRALFTDYKILQPFDQLAREPFTLTDDKKELLSIAMPRAPRVGVEEHGAAQSTDRLKRAGWSFNRGVHALPYEDGSYGLLAVETESVKGSVVRDGKPIPFGDSDDVLRTEVIRGMELIASGQV
jgi:hypothetical protein